MTTPGISLIFDSGAYSAFTQKKVIDLEKYCDFLLANKDVIYSPVCLDSINPDGPEAAAAQGWDNFIYMRDRGVENVMPVFHAREHTKWLDKMLEATGYIGLSGTSLVSPSEHVAWYNLIWNYITDVSGRPVADFHAFGDTSPVSMKNYPWATADSATWQITSGRTACIMIDGKPFQLRSKMRRDRQQHLSADDPAPKKQVWEDLITRRGLNVDMLMKRELRPVELTTLRCFLNASYLMDVQETSRERTTYLTNPLFGVKKYGPGQARVGPVKLYFVVSTAVCAWALPVLAKLGIRNILMSYYYMERKFWDKEFVPYLWDPDKACQENPRFKKYYDLLEEFTLVP